MKILYLTTVDPYSSKSGGTIAARNDIELLSQKYDIEIKFCPPLPGRILGKNFYKFLKSILCLNSIKVSSYSSISQFNNYSNYDIIWCNIDFSAFDYKNILASKKHFIIRKQNFESDLVSKFFLFGYEKKKIKNFEKIVMNKASRVIHISEKEYMKDENNNKSLLYPTILESSEYNNSINIDFDTRNIDILMVSDFSWKPNKDGIEWFLGKVFPLLKESYNLHLIGKLSDNYHDPIKKIFGHGYVEDIEDFYKRSKLFIVPIISGAGVKIKLLEAMKYKLPILTTIKGVEGLPLKDENEILIAYDSVDFSNKLVNLLDNESLANKLATNAFKWLLKNCSLNANIKKIENLLKT